MPQPVPILLALASYWAQHDPTIGNISRRRKCRRARIRSRPADSTRHCVRQPDRSGRNPVPRENSYSSSWRSPCGVSSTSTSRPLRYCPGCSSRSARPPRRRLLLPLPSIAGSRSSWTSRASPSRTARRRPPAPHARDGPSDTGAYTEGLDHFVFLSTTRLCPLGTDATPGSRATLRRGRAAGW